MTGDRRVVVVSPHLDDAVLSAWLVLSAAPGVRVVSCFAAVPGAGVVGAWDARAVGGSVTARRAEDRRALARTGSEPVHLDVLDAQYRSGSDGDALEELTRLLEPQLLDAEDVWLPAALGGHVDHRLAREAALAACPHGSRCRVYADLPYAGQPAWPPSVTGGGRDAAVDLAGRLARRTRPEEHWRSVLAELQGASPPRVLRLTPGQRREKLRAVDEYRSQLTALRCAPRNPLRRRRIFAYEVYWTLR